MERKIIFWSRSLLIKHGHTRVTYLKTVSLQTMLTPHVTPEEGVSPSMMKGCPEGTVTRTPISRPA